MTAPIDQLTNVPSTTDPTNFDSKADNLFGVQIPNMIDQFNAAIAAFNFNSTNDTSTTSNTIGTGSKTFTVSASKSFLPAMFLIIADTAAATTNYLFCQVKSYNSGTGELIVEVVAAVGIGTKTAWTIFQTTFGGAERGANSSITSLTGLTSPITGIGHNSKIQPISASVAANALTITLNPTSLDFRSPTLGSGAVNTRTIAAAISMTVSSGSSLGTVNATAARLALLAIDNAGTVELAITNLSGGVNLDETMLISTTAEGGAGAADSASVIYSTTARTNVPFRIVGFIDITEATAGTWATAPSRIQGDGGNSLASMLGFGNGQTWQALAGSRSFETTYYNTTGKPIAVAINFHGTSTTSNATLVINGITVGNYGTSATPSGFNSQLFGIVPPGGSYVCSVTNCSISYWAELR